ncbi:hypothetical protein [Roseateles asaccharophilus]|uniref:hypothetical protein n=1 Tax=Roseateles asaccharophilus TaxID=582607 RepID=UPI00384E327F
MTDLTLVEAGGNTFRVHETTRNGGKDLLRVLLGGTVVAEARDTSKVAPESRLVRLQFHGGRNTWMLEDEWVSPARIYPRRDFFGSLPKMMAEFEKATGLRLPEVKIAHLGHGICEYTAAGVVWQAENPWHLEVGQTYQVIRDRLGGMRRFQAVEQAGRVRVCMETPDGLSEPIDPSMIFNEMAWLTLRKVDLGTSLVEQPAPARRAMKP